MGKNGLGIEICHKEHYTMGERRSRSEVTFEDNDMWALYHLAQKYAQGCVPEFIQSVIINQLNTDFKDELAEDLKRWREHKASSPEPVELVKEDAVIDRHEDNVNVAAP